MKVAFVCAAPASDSPTAAWREALAEGLAERFELTRYGPEVGAVWAGRKTEVLRDLRPREVERILWVLEDDPAAAFAIPYLRDIGGIVALRAWEQTALVRAAFPALDRGGLRSDLVVLRAGGLDQLKAWRRERRAGAGAPTQPLHRPLVRFGDGYLVPDQPLCDRVLRDRNAPTPVAVTRFGDGPADAAEVVPEWAAILEKMPTQRAGRESLLKTVVDGADARRAARKAGELG